MVLKELCALRGISGDEGKVREYIRTKIEPYAQVQVDRMGNLIAFKRGSGENRRHIVVSAHMDEVGMNVSAIEDNGCLRYNPVGGIDPRIMYSTRVLVGESALPGVIGMKAMHLITPLDREHVKDHSEMFVDIGALDKASAEKLVSVGDSITFDSPWVDFGEGLVKARALDDRIGCMEMISLLEGDYPCDLTCIFTVMEEVGCIGAKVASFERAADAVVILECTTANDIGNVKSREETCRLGEGVVLSVMDLASIANGALYKRLSELAQEKEIPWQIKRRISGGNEARVYQRHTGARATCVLSAPCRYIHSPSCVAAYADIEAQYRLVEAFLLEGGIY